mgnify:CR=1 FL=1|tara:strand:+ start:822 stop:2159 length:1338 start_codon:yes stop_codon:yes gene_type:complete
MKYFIPLFKILFSLICLSSLSVNAADLFVYSGASYPDYSSIATAIDSSNDGDRILVSSATYNDDLNIYHKTISIIPMTSSDDFIIQGDIIFHQDYPSTVMKKVTLSSAQIIGTIITNGTLITPYEFNMIDCEMFGDIFLNKHDISTNLYYSKFYNQISLNHSSEIVGNTMVAASGSTTLEVLAITDGVFNTSGVPESAIIKIYANKIEDYRLNFNLLSSTVANEINIANNYIFSDLSASSSNSALIQLTGPVTTSVVRNNTLQRYMYSSSSHFVKVYQTLLKIEIFNNLFLQDGNYGNSSFLSFSSSTITYLKNNFFNYDFSNGNTFYLFTSNLIPNSFFDSDNIYDDTFSNPSSINSTNLNDSSGVPLTNLLTATENLGLNVIECRDIDDTQNDIGTWGGPYSWANYHTPSIGKGKIIDINLISTFGSSSNSLLNIRSKAINTK